MKLSGKVAAITGAARGIGKACAKRFLDDGVKVVISDVDADGSGNGRRARAAGGIAHRAMARRRRADVDRLVATAVKEFGRLDIMVNNAGVARNRDILEISEEEFDEIIGINLKGAFFGVQAAAKQMIAQGSGGGVIINMSSVNALLAIPALATYAMSKGGMKQLTSVAAVALAPHNIRVVAVGPGTILTDMVASSIYTSEDARKTVMSRTPAGRGGEPSEVASVVAFLASDDASYITGQTIYPDGGRLILNYTVPVKDK